MTRLLARGSATVRAALGYSDGQLVAIECEHDAYPSSAASWTERGYRVEILSQRDALARWDKEIRRV